MIKSGIDQQALIEKFANASAKQADQLRQTVYQATLGALQGRELNLKNVRNVLTSVTKAAGTGVAKNPLAGTDAQTLLDKAVGGMDDALLKAVDANRVALQKLADRGVDLREGPLKKALADIDKFEASLFGAISKAATSVGDPMSGVWGKLLNKMSPGSTQVGAGASQAGEQIRQQVEQLHGAMQATRNAGLQAAQTLAESYTALVSGVLMGMADAIHKRRDGDAGGKSR